MLTEKIVLKLLQQGAGEGSFSCVGSCLFKLNNGGKEGGVTAADSGRRARRREGEGIRGERGIEAMLV